MIHRINGFFTYTAKKLYKNVPLLIFACFIPVVVLLATGLFIGNRPSPLYMGRGGVDYNISAMIMLIFMGVYLFTVPELHEYRLKKKSALFIIIENTIICLLCSLMLTLFRFIYGRTNSCNVFYWFGAYFFCLGCVFALVYFTAALSRDIKKVKIYSYIIYGVSVVFSGAVFPFFEMPKLLNNFIPLTHCIKLLRCVAMEEPIKTMYIEFVILAAVLAVCIMTAMWVFTANNNGNEKEKR